MYAVRDRYVPSLTMCIYWRVEYRMQAVRNPRWATSGSQIPPSLEFSAFVGHDCLTNVQNLTIFP